MFQHSNQIVIATCTSSVSASLGYFIVSTNFYEFNWLFSIYNLTLFRTPVRTCIALVLYFCSFFNSKIYSIVLEQCLFTPNDIVSEHHRVLIRVEDKIATQEPLQFFSKWEFPKRRILFLDHLSILTLFACQYVYFIIKK